MKTDAILSPEEIIALTGYKIASKQLRELQRQGFHRARRSMVTGEVILERPHFEAICRGETQSETWQPRLRPA